MRSLSELPARVRDEAFVCEVSWRRGALANHDMERGVVVSTISIDKPGSAIAGHRFFADAFRCKRGCGGAILLAYLFVLPSVCWLSGNVPNFRDKNSRHFVDHVFFTMDHVAPHHSREMLADIALSAFGAQDCTDPHEFKGVVVKETHSDGTDHLHGCFTYDWYVSIGKLLDDARAADLVARGWKELPEMQSKRFRVGGGGQRRFVTRSVPTPRTGVRWHFNVLFSHVYAPQSKEVQQGKKRSNDFKSPWRFNDMVEYLLNASKDKVLDNDPLFINCDAGSILLDPAMCEPNSLIDLTRRARLLKRNSVTSADALEDLVLRCGTESRHIQNLQVAIKAYDLQCGAPPVVFMPSSLADGSIEGAKPLQRWVCRFLESDYIGEANGLWISGAPGYGKTTLMKLLQIRYPDAVCAASLRGASNSYDRTSLAHYSADTHRIVIFNDVKPVDSVSQKWSPQFFHLLREITDGFLR